MRRQVGAQEDLDGEHLDPAVLRGNLRDLARVNRLLGGVRLSRAAIAELVAGADGGRQSGPLRILDIGTGGADVPLALLTSWSGRRRLEIVAIDRNPQILDAAVAIQPRLARTTGLRLETGDGRSLPYEDGTFDVTHASLVLHHLDEPDAALLIGEMGRVARIGIVLNDLSRSRLGLIGAWLLGHVLTRNRFTRRDAPMSVRRAYTASEAVAMIQGAGLAGGQPRYGLARHRWALVGRHP